MQGSARKDVVFGAGGVYPVTVPGPKWKSWINISTVALIFFRQRNRWGYTSCTGMPPLPQKWEKLVQSMKSC